MNRSFSEAPELCAHLMVTTASSHTAQHSECTLILKHKEHAVLAPLSFSVSHLFHKKTEIAVDFLTCSLLCKGPEYFILFFLFFFLKKSEDQVVVSGEAAGARKCGHSRVMSQGVLPRLAPCSQRITPSSLISPSHPKRRLISAGGSDSLRILFGAEDLAFVS